MAKGVFKAPTSTLHGLSGGIPDFHLHPPVMLLSPRVLFSRHHRGLSSACGASLPSPSARSPPLPSSVQARHRASSSPSLKADKPARESQPYYITTPIFYVNAAPHVGHLYSMVLADILKRWQHLQGRDALLCTGTDEHGMKVQRAAEKAGSDTKAFCDDGAAVFKNLAQKADISYDRFIRTTDEDHSETVQYAWRILIEKDLIYRSKHEGWYSVSDETFVPASGVHKIVDPPTGRKIHVSIETGNEVEWSSETNYCFRLSSFRDRLLEHYEQVPNFMVPSTRMQDVQQAVRSGLEDLSISRPSQRLSWGIPVPGDESQTIYVWLDALLNYLTFSGYPWAPNSQSTGGWPAQCQVIGKDIVRFHCIYWPAFLMALDIQPPKRILTHAHWTLGHQKMAKSTGNVVNPFFAMDRFTTDVMRYYLAHDGGVSQDADYDNAHIIKRYKKGLHGGLGGLTSRITRGKQWNVREAVRFGISEDFLQLQSKSLTNRWGGGPFDYLDNTSLTTRVTELWGQLFSLRANVDHFFHDLDVKNAVNVIMNVIHQTNIFLSYCEPWAMASKVREEGVSEEKKQRMTKDLNTVIFLCAECLRICGILLQPFMPDRAARLLDMLGVEREASEISINDDVQAPDNGIDIGQADLDLTGTESITSRTRSVPIQGKRSSKYAEPRADGDYGEPKVDVGRGLLGVLFPPPLSDT
ncbi:MAG: methionyl-tRNA synthetase [Alyxoria varia]|nr:MAG: methionyl-tRNA synthetase [Alyxoria varia]